MNKNLKLSKYNKIIHSDKKTIIYNIASSGVLLLNEYYSNEFQQIEKGIFSNNDLVEELKKGSMLVEKDLDEVKSLKVKNLVTRFNTSTLGLTIAPTLNCNFRCIYCYENGVQYGSMNKQTQDDLIKFLDNYLNISTLSISWYGGEPLLELDTIEYLTKSILNKYSDKHLNYNASMVTNGYLLTPEIAKKLTSLNITNIQITLDGIKNIHDNRRILANGQGSFDTIINNIKNCCDLIDIVVRINIDKSNLESTKDLIHYLNNLNLLTKISFYIAPVDDINSSCKNSLCLTPFEFSETEISFFKDCLDIGLNLINIPSPNMGICGAVCLNNFVISPTGHIYKCWDEIGRENASIGTLKEGITFNPHLINWLSHSPMDTLSDCRDCDMLAICNGGCAYNNIKNNQTRCCTTKHNYNNLITLLYRSKL